MQEFDEPAAGLLRLAVEETPSGMQVWLLSRTVPLREFSGLEASGALELVGQDELDFTLDELRRLLPRWDDALVEQLHRRTGGWPAGVMLASRHASMEGPPHTDADPATQADWRDGIFRFFAHAVLDAMSTADQRILMLSALLTELKVADVCRLTGDDDAGRVLETSYRRSLFTTYRRGVPGSYHFHALFREFLLAEAVLRLDEADVARARDLAADLLVAADEVSAAMQVLVDAGQWRRAVEVLRRAAPRLLDNGRYATLKRWEDALPRAEVDTDPWLLYFLGEARAHDDGVVACDWYERAHARFVACIDLEPTETARGRALCAASAIALLQIAEVTYKDFASWAERLFDAMRTLPETLMPGDDLTIAAAVAAASNLSVAQSSNDEIRANIERVVELMEVDPLSRDRRTLASSCAVILYCQPQRDEALFARVHRLVAPRLADERESVVLRIRWWIQASACYAVFSLRAGTRRMVDAAHAAAREARRLAEREEVRQMEFELMHLDAHLALLSNDDAEYGNLMIKAEAFVDMSRPYQVQQHYEQLCGVHLMRDQFDEALRAAKLGWDAMQRASSPATYAYNLMRGYAYTLIALGRADEAVALVETFLPQMTGRYRATLVGLAHLARAWALRGDPERYSSALALAIETLEKAESFYFMMHTPRLAARVCSDALDRGIGVEFIRRCIERRDIKPPADASAAWPWVVRIRVLGPFELSVRGEPAAFGPKTPRRQVELIQAIAAAGENGLETWRAVDWLWPEGDAGKNSLDVTVHRVRRLLGEPKAISVRDGKLFFDASLVWTDVLEFDALVAGLAKERLDTLDDAVLDLLGQRLVAAYRGPFVADAVATSWLTLLREQLQDRHARAARALGDQLERRGRWASAVDLYANALQHDALREEFYRGQIRSHLALAQPSEALTVYRRCRHQLSVVLGLPPAQPTQALVRELIAHE